jgi:RNA polymerase sigma-70 factor, ECF subfamily
MVEYVRVAPISAARPDGPHAESVFDELLVQRLRQGCDTSFEILVHRHRPLVERVVAAVLKEPKNREEAVQDVFMSVYRKIDLFRGDSTFTTWIYRVARNAALLRRRREKTRQIVPLCEKDLEQATNGGHLCTRPRSTDADLMRGEARSMIEVAVGRLDEKYRKVFHLREIEGYSTQKTAELLDLGVPAVKSRLRRARLSLRRSLEAYFDRVEA